MAFIFLWVSSSLELFASVIVRFNYITISLLTALVFLPMIGRGFIHDDFVHLCSAAYDPLWRGLTKANGGPFYAPVAWLTFKVDWMLWGWKPVAYAVINLILHITNILLVNRLAFHLYQSAIAARWAAIGFALLYPANTWAIMWISTRAHIIVTLFYLAALLSAVWYARAKRHKLLAATAIVVFAILSMFSKESGITIPISIALVLFNQRITQKHIFISRAGIVGLFAILLIALLSYTGIRAQSGAIPITFFHNQWYTYTLAPQVVLENLLRYGWRTYGLLAIMAGAVALSRYLHGCAPSLKSLAKGEIAFSLALFAITIAPFILLPRRSGIYTYLPGVAAALLLGAVVRAWCEPSYGPTYELPLKPPPRRVLITASPIILIIVTYCFLTVGHSFRWLKMAEINTTILRQIVAQRAKVEPNTVVILTYSEIDLKNRFPESLAWGFSPALRILYSDHTVSGSLIHSVEPYRNKPSEIHFVYQRGINGEPEVISKSFIHY
jgi:hypothetical protein